MTYVPTYVVAQNGEDILNFVVDEVLITHGRQDVIDQPYPASMTLKCFSNAGNNLDFLLNDTIQFQIDGFSQFVGYITSINISMTQGINNQNIVYYELSAAGPLANLSKTNVRDITLPFQGEIERMSDLLQRAFGLIWNDLGNSNQPSFKWSDYPPYYNWNSIGIAYPFASAPLLNGSSQVLVAAFVPDDL